MSNLTFDFHGNQLRTIVDHKNVEWFHAGDVCHVLEFTNVSRTLSDNVKADWKKEYSDGIRGGKAAWYISEPGLFKLIFKAKTPQAEKFQDWVFEEVLPKLRASGGYIMSTATSEQLEALQNEISAMQETKYLLESVFYQQFVFPITVNQLFLILKASFPGCHFFSRIRIKVWYQAYGEIEKEKNYPTTTIKNLSQLKVFLKIIANRYHQPGIGGTSEQLMLQKIF
jgi:prophage antirepressor-like protein